MKRRWRRNRLVTEWLPPYCTDAPILTRLMNIIMDALVSCRRINYVPCLDDYTDASLAITVALQISGVQVTYILERIMLLRGYLETIRTSQRTAFTCMAFLNMMCN